MMLLIEFFHHYHDDIQSTGIIPTSTMGWALKAETWSKIEAAQVSSFVRAMVRVKRQELRP